MSSSTRSGRVLRTASSAWLAVELTSTTWKPGTPSTKPRWIRATMKSSSTTSTRITPAPPRGGRRAVNTAPTSLRTVTSPPRRRQTRPVRASPKPRVAPVPGLLVEKPRSKTRCSRPASTPGPLSRTTTTTSGPSSRTSTSTQRPPVASPACTTASRALSTRLPTTVVRSTERSSSTRPSRGPVGEPQADPALGGQAGLGHEQRRQRGVLHPRGDLVVEGRAASGSRCR